VAVSSTDWLDIKGRTRSRSNPAGTTGPLMHSNNAAAGRSCPPICGLENAPPMSIAIQDLNATKQVTIVPRLLTQPCLRDADCILFVFRCHGFFRSNENKMSDGWRESAGLRLEGGISWQVRNRGCQPFAPSPG
jgi:hypothetical protein